MELKCVSRSLLRTADQVRSETPNLRGACQKLLEPSVRRVFSTIYGNLLATSGAKKLRTVLVCSAGQEEGASFVAAGLAVAVAENCLGEVLLIDGNFYHPTVAETFGLSGNDGFAEFLTGRTAEPVITKTSVPQLSVMSAGKTEGEHIHALEPLRFQEFLGKLASFYAFIVLDGPAVNSYPESALYASQVDRALLIIRARVARGPVVAKALDKLSKAGCDNPELILNRRTFPIPQSVYQKL